MDGNNPIMDEITGNDHIYLSDYEKKQVLWRLRRMRPRKMTEEELVEKQCSRCRFRSGDRPCVWPKGVCRL